MVTAIRVTEENLETLTGHLTELLMGLDGLIGDIIVYRPNDVVLMNQAAFDYQYEFVGPEDPFKATEVRVKDTPEARAERLAIRDNNDDGIEWDIDANLPMYTRDYIRMYHTPHTSKE